MKKLVCLALAVMMLAGLGLDAGARDMNVPIGTVVGHTLYTDIVALIDGHPIRSYNVDNRTVVVAEDLRAYGFHVIWHAESRWLEIVRPVVNNEPLTPEVYPDYTPEVPAAKIGTPARDILATDIVTTVAGETVVSCNIGGETCIAFRELERYGEMGYDNKTRVSTYVTQPYKVLAGGHAAEGSDPDPSAAWSVVRTQPTERSVTAAFTAGEGPGWSGYLGKDKSSVDFAMLWSVETDPVISVTISFYSGQMPEANSLRRDLFDTLCSLPIPSVAETIDYTNTPEVRAAVAEVYRVTLNGKAVTGDLWRAPRNGHTDFVFLFDKGFEIRPGDEIAVTVIAAAQSEELDAGIMAPDATPKQILDALKAMGNYIEIAGIENDLCWVSAGYYEESAIFVEILYKGGGRLTLRTPVLPEFQTIDTLAFGNDGKILYITGRVPNADKFTTVKIDIYSGEIVV